jgi:hypothetical protein
MTKKLKVAKSAKLAKAGKAALKFHYKRSTPVIRLRRNVQKLAKHAELCRDRLAVWKSSENPIVKLALDAVANVQRHVRGLEERVIELETSKFVPPTRTPTWQPTKGEIVAVATDSKPKFKEIYESVLAEDPRMLDELSVVRTLSTGEVVVRRGKRTPFTIRKSHLVRVSASA